MTESKALPSRSTRGKRMRAAMEEDEADNEFWNQDFFAEEAEDNDYQESAEEEDVPDSDFDAPEEEDDDDEEIEVKERPRKKALKAPEPKGPPRARPPKPPSTPAAGGGDDEDGEPSTAPKPKRSAPQIPIEPYSAPSLRKSTMARVAYAEQVRSMNTQPKRQRQRSKSSVVMSQVELLHEAARTEIDNMQSLKVLLAMEEATKKKAQIVKQTYTGPSVKIVSRRRPLPGVVIPEKDPTEQKKKKKPKEDTRRADSTRAAPGMPGQQQQQQQQGSEKKGGNAAEKAAEEEQEEEKEQQDDSRKYYEATLSYELHNMNYPPVWLRRFKAPAPPQKVTCSATGQPARYRDPKTGAAFASVAAYKRLKNIPDKPKPPIPQPEPVTLKNASFNAASTTFASQPKRQTLSAAAQRALSAIPPDAGAFPEPSPYFAMDQPRQLQHALMALVIEASKA